MFKPVYKAGGAGGGDASAFTAATEIYNTSAGDLRHTITPTVYCWWEVECQCIVRVLDAAWYRCDFELWFDLGGGVQTADARGATKGSTWIIEHHNALSYVTARTSMLLKCQAGLLYGCRPVLTPTAGTWTWFTNGQFTFSRSKVVGCW
jgi:hypothetical protein